MTTNIKTEKIKKAIHPTEASRFAIALTICIPVVILVLVSIFYGLPFISSYELIIIVFVILSIILGAWFTLSVMKAHLMGNSVKVSEKNFPEIHEIAEEVKSLLDYKKNVPIYIVQGGGINAFVSKYFRVKFITLNSSLVEGMIGQDQTIQMKWIIARFIGALKVKHFRLTPLKITVESIQKIKILNIFLLPYERATQYSGDNIGLLVCDDLNEALRAFDKLLVGNKLAEKVNFNGILDQHKDIKGSFFAFMARIFSTHPHIINRYLNLLAFAKWKYPEKFDSYISENSHNLNLRSLLPDYYKEKSPQKLKNQDSESA